MLVAPLRFGRQIVLGPTLFALSALSSACNVYTPELLQASDGVTLGGADTSPTSGLATSMPPPGPAPGFAVKPVATGPSTPGGDPAQPLEAQPLEVQPLEVQPLDVQPFEVQPSEVLLQTQRLLQAASESAASELNPTDVGDAGANDGGVEAGLDADRH